MRALVLATGWLLACTGRDAVPPMIDPTQIPPLVARHLARLRAAEASQLVEGAPRRALAAGPWMKSPYGNAGWVPIVLAPSTYKVPTEIGLRFTFSQNADGTLAVEEPARADLVAATRLALEGEVRAVTAGSEALATTAGPPPGRSWSDTLRIIRLDPRLPAGQFFGEPSWQLIYDPWDEARGGYHNVLLSLPSFSVISAR